MATGGDVVCRVWEAGSWRLTREIRSADGASSVAVAFSPDGSTLAVATSSGSIRLVDAASGDAFATLPVPGGRQAIWLAFSPDGGRLAAYSTHVTHVWDLRAVRGRLAEMGLDWDAPHLPAPPVDPLSPQQMRVDLGNATAPR